MSVYEQCVVVERNGHVPLESCGEISPVQFLCDTISEQRFAAKYINNLPQIIEMRFNEDWYTFEKSISRISSGTHYIIFLGKDASVAHAGIMS